MLTDIVAEIDAIYDLSGVVATLDNLISLAMVWTLLIQQTQSRILHLVYSVEEQISARDDYVCPTFSNEIRIVDAVHPLLEGNVRNTMAVPNNIVGIF